MGRIAIGLAAGLGIWFGSMAAAEAQPTITTTGPTAISAGSTSTTYSAAITLVTPSMFHIKIQVYRNNVQFHISDNLVPNPGITNPTYSRTINLTSGCNGGDVFKFCVKLVVGTTTITATDWTVTVPGTRPSSKLAQMDKRVELAFQAIDRDRRRE